MNLKEREDKAREKANLPINHGPLAWAILGLLIALGGIAVLADALPSWVDLSFLSEQNQMILGLGLILGGVVASAIISSWWHNEMSLRNLGHGIRTLDALAIVAIPSKPRQAKQSIAPDEMPQSQLQLPINRYSPNSKPQPRPATPKTGPKKGAIA